MHLPQSSVIHCGFYAVLKGAGHFDDFLRCTFELILHHKRLSGFVGKADAQQAEITAGNFDFDSVEITGLDRTGEDTIGTAVFKKSLKADCRFAVRQVFLIAAGQGAAEFFADINIPISADFPFRKTDFPGKKRTGTQQQCNYNMFHL